MDSISALRTSWKVRFVLGSNRRVDVISETIYQIHHGRWDNHVNRGLRLVLRVLYSGPDAAHANARQ